MRQPPFEIKHKPWPGAELETVKKSIDGRKPVNVICVVRDKIIVTSCHNVISRVIKHRL